MRCCRIVPSFPTDFTNQNQNATSATSADAKVVFKTVSTPTFYNQHRPHRALSQAAPLRPLPQNVIDLETLRVRRRDRAAGLLHEYQQVA